MEGITMPLFEGQEHYQRLMKLAMDTSWSGILIADREGQYLFANRRYEELTGWSNEVVQELDSQVLGQYLIREKVSTVDLVLQQKKEVLLVQSSSCDERIFLVRGVPYFDQSGVVAYVICHLLELSALQHYTNSLESSRRKSQHVFEDFVKIADQNGAYSEKIIFRSQAMYQVMEQINLVAQTDATVLIRGESGVGKELFAKRLHDASSRRGQPFIRLNCSAIPDALLESELFGYEAGAFTGGSAKGKKGLLEHANRGTMLLDEIGTMPVSLQSKLLRVLQEREYTKLGGHEPIQADVRFIAATNADLEGMVREGSFREDLYYRLNIIPIRIPPLRERKEDIPVLVRHFIRQLNSKYQLRKAVSPEAMEVIAQRPFPGNVRQLRNFLERMALLSANDCLTREDVDRFYSSETLQDLSPEPFTFGKRSLQEMMDAYEKYILTEYKKRFKSSYKVAEQLGTNQSTISRKFRKYQI